ncbi:uncharacterized protein A4U43_C03F6000 [Asparagus officinalis]|uniref:Uncharacterized protein n=1 Tax=Asparagus officinalis TaxID=4686 RepID=A0A5P1FAH4_ASPOF|nr:uncharacterized protein A4U43_C03F6000 [Asparagus officinalis]
MPSGLDAAMRSATWARVSGEALDALGGGGVEGALGLDEAAEGDVGGDEVGVEGLPGEEACVVLQGEDPVLEVLAVVGDAGGEGDGVPNDLEGDWAEEE